MKWPALAIAAAVVVVLSASVGCSADETADYAVAMNRGKAYLELRDSAHAIEHYSRALAIEPDSAAAMRNLARARLLARDAEAALTILDRARAAGGESVATSYLTGLAHVRLSQFEKAVPYFLDAVRLDASVATLRYQLANAYQATNQSGPAIEQLRQTLRLDPLHISAHYKLAGYSRKAGDLAAAEHHQLEVARLRQVFGDETRSPEMLEICEYSRAESVASTWQPQAGLAGPGALDISFIEATSTFLPTIVDTTAISSVAVLEMDDNGRYTLFVLMRNGEIGLLVPENGDGFRWVAVDAPLSGDFIPGAGTACIVGDYLDDAAVHAWNDVLLLAPGGAALLKRTGLQSFEDVTADAGLTGLAGRQARWVDHERDGDLDLLVAAAGGLQLWQNSGDGEFEEILGSMDLGDLDMVRDLATADLHRNLETDAVLARGELPTLVLENSREGRFARPGPLGPWPAAHLLLTNDLDNDGHPDVILLGPGEAHVIPGRGASRHHLDLGGLAPTAATLVDIDNDGWLDLLIAGNEAGTPGEFQLALWKNMGGEDWLDVTQATGLAPVHLTAAVHSLLAADIDTDGDTDLLVTTAAGLRYLRNDGGNINHQIKLRLVGTKTNHSGFGAHVEIRREGLWLTRSVQEPIMEIGLGRTSKLDTLQTIWTNGIIDNQVDLTVARQPLTIVEQDVPAGSCPYLYAWDGQGFSFVTDILGNSPLGLPVSRGVLMPSDPDELAWVGTASTFLPRGNVYVLQVTDELREVLYLDEAQLVAADHPPGTEVHSTDKLVAPPFPPSELWVLTGATAPILALGDDGIDRTDAVRSMDGNYAPAGVLLPPPMRGMTRPLELTLDFGSLDIALHPVLALTGWLQYGDASSNIALSQSSRTRVILPRLEAESPAGRWLPVDVPVGMPAGKSKTILVDLDGKIPAGTHRLRLLTTFELRWDRITLLARAPAESLQTHASHPAGAHLSWRGFSAIETRAPLHPMTPEFDDVVFQPLWRTTPQGWGTRYGDVRELLAASDAQLVIESAGDALELTFDVTAFPPLLPGLERSFFLYSVGWDKALHPNAVDGDTIAPLPAVADNDQEWQLQYNTRWIPLNRFARPRASH